MKASPQCRAHCLIVCPPNCFRNGKVCAHKSVCRMFILYEYDRSVFALVSSPLGLHSQPPPLLKPSGSQTQRLPPPLQSQGGVPRSTQGGLQGPPPLIKPMVRPIQPQVSNTMEPRRCVAGSSCRCYRQIALRGERETFKEVMREGGGGGVLKRFFSSAIVPSLR